MKDNLEKVPKGNVLKENIWMPNVFRGYAQREGSRETIHREAITAEALQKAIIWSEVLGRPVSKRRRILHNGNQNHVGRR